MPKKRTKTFTRRDFLKASAGAVAAVGIGCSDKEPRQAPQVGVSGQGGAGVAGSYVPGGTTGGSAMGGSGGAFVTGGSSAGGGGQGGAGSGGIITGGTPASGGIGGSGPAGSGGGVAGTGEAGSAGSVAGTGEAGGAAGSGAAGSGGSGGSGSALVGMVRDSDWAKATRDAIELAGGLPDLTGKTVLLKPNIISSTPHPETTNVEVIRAAIQAVKAKGAARIVVAEDGFATSGMRAMNDLGVTALCSEEGAEALSLQGTETERVNPAGASVWPDSMLVYRTVLDADYVINMPVCKTHGIANFSLAFKNWYGIIPTGRDHSTRTIGARLAELHLAKQEDFVILDASRAILTGGPTIGAGSTPGEPKIVVASRDAIAADVTGLCILKQFGTAVRARGAVYNMGVWEQPQIVRALELAFPGWISSVQNYSYEQQGVIDHAEIMAWRDA
ncbi:MAG: DUF362 domain-containing protein [Deltaproteobacteria bacterium]|nr:DUF362 domain-containing protein [Deltaproteobacteria bacterium]